MKVSARKKAQRDELDVNTLVTACANCRIMLEEGLEEYNMDLRGIGLTELLTDIPKKSRPMRRPENAEQKRRAWIRLLHSGEGRVLAIGLVLSLLGISGLALSWLWAPPLSQVLVAMTAANILFGRAAAMSFGYAVNLSHGVVVPVNMLIETILVLLFYPLFVFSWRQLVEIRGLSKIIKRTTRAAEANRETIRKYGMIGLLAFVCFPFWMTGPVVGCAIGFLLGLRTWVNLTVVLAGTYLAIGGWALLLRELHARVAEYSVFGPMVLMALIVLIAVAGYLLHREHPEGGAGKGKD